MSLFDSTDSLRVTFHVSVPEDAVKLIFGFMGTHIVMGSGGATTVLELAESFRQDALGRKIVVRSQSTRAAALALISFIYELTNISLSVESSKWMYVDPHNRVHGPYDARKIISWLEKKYFDPQLPVMLANPVLPIWIPVCMVEAIMEIIGGGTGMETEYAEYVSMREDDLAMDWEQSIDEDLAVARQRIDVAPTSSHLDSVIHARVAMDYDASDLNVFGCIEKSVHVCILLDTNVLLSHFSFLERRFQGIMHGTSNRGNVLSLILVIPWVVLCELDHLKDGRPGLREAAMYAIKRIHTLASARDSYLFVQGASNHKRAVDEISLPAGQAQTLRNDDFIMQACLFFKERLVKKMREKKHRAHCVLVSNDRGLQLRAKSNGIACIKAVEVDGSVDRFVATVEERDGGQGCDDASNVEQNTSKASQEVEDFLGTLKLQPAPDFHPVPQTAVVEGKKKPSFEVVADAIQHGLGAFVMYARQQDLGELWEDLLEDELKPPWEAAQVLKVLTRHSSTFWGIIDRRILEDAKVLLRYLHQSRFSAHAHECLIIAKKLLNASYTAFGKPLVDSLSEAPDPATIHGFVSLGDAKAAILESIESLSDVASSQ
jgi:rRNA-processing protein FCF1